MSDRSERRRSKGTPVDVVAAKKKLSRSSEGQHGQLVAPMAEAIREAIEAGKCPWCGRGPFQLLALHVNHKHGIDRVELRDLAGVTMNTSICAPEYSETKREQGKRNGPVPKASGDKPRRKPRISAAAREVLRQNGLRFSFEERSAMGKVGGPRGGAIRGDQLRKPRPPCEVCGTTIPFVSGKTQLKTCSPECRRVHKSRATAQSRAERRSETCKHGHLLSGDNLKISPYREGERRQCMECRRRASREYRARKRSTKTGSAR